MSEVRLSVGGRDYTVACSEGEEGHVSRLGEVIDAKLQQLGTNLSAKEAQNLLFAALLLADELHELRAAATDAGEAQDRMSAEVEQARTSATTATEERDRHREAAALHESNVRKLSAEVETLRRERDDLASRLEDAGASGSAGLYDDPSLPPALERFADLLENCADKLEGAASGS